jgi:hypothetical protein
MVGLEAVPGMYQKTRLAPLQATKLKRRTVTGIIGLGSLFRIAASTSNKRN